MKIEKLSEKDLALFFGDEAVVGFKLVPENATEIEFVDALQNTIDNSNAESSIPNDSYDKIRACQTKSGVSVASGNWTKY